VAAANPISEDERGGLPEISLLHRVPEYRQGGAVGGGGFGSDKATAS
jgi:hypothetical protein